MIKIQQTPEAPQLIRATLLPSRHLMCCWKSERVISYIYLTVFKSIQLPGASLNFLLCLLDYFYSSISNFSITYKMTEIYLSLPEKTDLGKSYNAYMSLITFLS